MKLLIVVFFAALLSSFFFLIEFQPSSRNKGLYKEENPAEAHDALTFLTAMNAFPNADIPKDGYAKAWQKHLQIAALSNYSATRNAWINYGPNNIGGRTLCIAIDPADTSVIWLGSASGGLWKSTTGGIGSNAWTYVQTGFPVLGVSAIAINPNDHNEMFIGTGETYAYGTSTNGLVDRTTRGSFGIGILKTNDGGSTWTHVLDWTYQANRGVWDIVYNPLNTNILYAATTEGVYKTMDGGSAWNQVLDREMVMDLVIDRVDTNTVFAGVGNEESADKGIYRTQNGGSTWSLLTSGLPANDQDGRITLADYEGDHNILMALIGNRYNTVGVYRTTNGGYSWIEKSSQDIVSWQGWYAKGLLVKSNDATRVLAGGVDLFRSIASGSSFSDISPNLDFFHSDVHDIVSNPLDANKIYIATDGGLYRSNDFGNSSYECTDGYVTSQHYIGSVSSTNPEILLGGLQDNYTDQYVGSGNWSPVLGGDGTYNAIDPTNDAIEYASYQYLNITKTTDYWSWYSTNAIYYSNSYPEGGNPAAYLAPFILSPSAPNTIYAGTTTLIKSTNGGSNWNNVQPDPVDNGNYVLSIAVSANDPDTVYFGTAPTDGHPMHVYRSFNGGFLKTDISAGLPNRYPRRITVNPDNAREVYVVFSGFSGIAGGHIFKSEDAGTTWSDVSTNLPDLPFHCLAIDPAYPENIYAGCDYTVYCSDNGGNDWFTYSDGLPEAVMIFDLVVSPSDNSIYAFTHGHGVYKNSLFDEGTFIQPVVTAASVNIFPNPAVTQFTIDLSHVTQDIIIDLFSASGKFIMEKKIAAAQQINYDVSQLASGTYLLNVKGNGVNYTGKIAIMR